MTKHVWRVQNQKGQGPYVGLCNEDLKAIGMTRSASTRHPPPWDDFGADLDEELYDYQGLWAFSFPTRRAAVAWFGEEALRRLQSIGFFLVRVPSERVIVSRSGKQVMFLRRDNDRQICTKRNERYFLQPQAA